MSESVEKQPGVPAQLQWLQSGLEILGKGGFGEVQQAQKTTTHNIIAIKILRKQLESELITNEIKVMKELKGSPQIVEFHSQQHQPEHGIIIIEMELMKGGSLRKLIGDKTQRITDEDASKIIFKICSALIDMNLKNISHNDLKPDNILISEIDDITSVKLADFGLAQFMGNQMDIGLRGTKIQQAPEQRESKKYSIESSVWALGIIMYELLVRAHPQHNQCNMDQQEFINQVNSGRLVKPKEFTDHAWLLQKAMMRFEFNKRVNLQEICSQPWITRNFDQNVYLAKDKSLMDQYCKIRKQNMSLVFSAQIMHQTSQIDQSEIAIKKIKGDLLMPKETKKDKTSGYLKNTTNSFNKHIEKLSVNKSMSFQKASRSNRSSKNEKI